MEANGPAVADRSPGQLLGTTATGVRHRPLAAFPFDRYGPRGATGRRRAGGLGVSGGPQAAPDP